MKRYHMISLLENCFLVANGDRVVRKGRAGCEGLAPADYATVHGVVCECDLSGITAG